MKLRSVKSCISFLMISVMSSTRLVGVWGVLESGSRPRYTSARARLNGVGVRGASRPRVWFRSGENFCILGVLWADMSEPRVGVVSRVECRLTCCTRVVSGVDCAAGCAAELTSPPWVGVEVRLPVMSKEMFGLCRN